MGGREGNDVRVEVDGREVGIGIIRRTVSRPYVESYYSTEYFAICVNCRQFQRVV